MSEFVDSLEIETWTLWSVGIVLVACRMISRRMKFRSWSSLQFEDWLMMVVAALFTADMVCINTTSKNGTNYMADEDVAKLTPLQAERAIYGSKVVLALELCSLGTIWLVKICLLILYHRLTVAYERQHLIVKIIGVFCIISFALVVFLLLFHWCSPIEGYWALPVTNSECATYYKHMIFATSFNISTDLMLLCIPIPIVIQSRIPMKRKIVLCCVLGLGCLNILVAVLNRYFNFTNPNSMFYLYWYVAELATAVYVGNLPLCWQLIAHVFSMGTWASFGSSADRPKAPLPGPADQEFIPKKKPKRFIQSMLPASLWSTQNDGLGGTTRVEGRRSGTVKTRSASEEAIVWSEAITEEEDRTDRDVELSAMDRKADASITSVDEVASPRRAGD